EFLSLLKRLETFLDVFTIGKIRRVETSFDQRFRKLRPAHRFYVDDSHLKILWNDAEDIFECAKVRRQVVDECRESTLRTVSLSGGHPVIRSDFHSPSSDPTGTSSYSR